MPPHMAFAHHPHYLLVIFSSFVLFLCWAGMAIVKAEAISYVSACGTHGRCLAVGDECVLCV